MEPIYVTGHKNPDTDSIVSAMAYAALRNALGDREFVAARLGEISDETQMVLDRFGMTPPIRLYNVRTQICDLDYDTPPALNAQIALSHAWSVFQDGSKVTAMPVTDEDGALYGMLTPSDIASYDMQSIHNPVVTEIPIFNLLSALEGRVLNDPTDVFDSISGEVVIALPQARPSLTSLKPDGIVICGQQPDVVRQSLEAGVNCVILCQADMDEFRGIQSDVCIISTPCDAYRAARMIYQSIPVARIAQTKELVAFHLYDYIDDVRESMLKSRYRSYPVLDENEKVVGTISRFHLIRPKRKRVVLVDHNEAAQSVPGLEQAEILEIIDHHRLADVQTGAPMYFRNEPVGSTSTIIAGMYQEKGLMPSEKLAGLIAAAILSDTVMFKSPTCTQRDRLMAERMARIAGISLDELGHDIFSASSSDEKPAAELLLSDFKDFHIAGHDIGIGQIICLDSNKLLAREAEFLQAMKHAMEKKQYDMILLMLTDVLLEGTQLLFLGDEDTIKTAFNAETHANTAFLPNVVSRKKQVVPMLSLLWG